MLYFLQLKTEKGFHMSNYKIAEEILSEVAPALLNYIMFNNDGVPHFSANADLKNKYVEIVDNFRVVDGEYIIDGWSVRELIGDIDGNVIGIKKEKDFKNFKSAFKNYVKRCIS